MNVAVADVAKSDDAGPRQVIEDGPGRRGDEVGDRRDGYGHVVFEARALALLRFGDRVTHAPQRVRFRAVLRDDGVRDDAGLDGLHQALLGFAAGVACRFEQHDPRMIRERHLLPGKVTGDVAQRAIRDQLECLDPVRHAMPQKRQ